MCEFIGSLCWDYVSWVKNVSQHFSETCKLQCVSTSRRWVWGTVAFSEVPSDKSNIFLRVTCRKGNLLTSCVSLLKTTSPAHSESSVTSQCGNYCRSTCCTEVSVADKLSSLNWDLFPVSQQETMISHSGWNTQHKHVILGGKKALLKQFAAALTKSVCDSWAASRRNFRD